MTESLQAAQAQSRALKGWLLEHAYPIWWERGADRLQGGFHEALTLDGEPVAAPRRARVQARQVYAYATAASLGWSGPAAEAVEHGLDFFIRHYRRRDGLFRSLVAASGETLDDSVMLYDQAFALFALSAAHRALGPERGLEEIAVSLRSAIFDRLRHAEGGFEVGMPPSLPLQSNPHMHLFEAALAWDEAGGDAGWRRLTDEIAELALARFIDRQTGALHEFFDTDWSKAPGVEGRIVEPGHQYEWAWLLLRWGKLAVRPDAIRAAMRLVEIAEMHGIDPVRGVAYHALLDDMSIHDPIGRLWPQTERIKAGALAALSIGDASFWETAAKGAEGLRAYFGTPVQGVWRDKMKPDGSFVDEPAPASSFYHIVCAIAELDRCLNAAERQ